jgi:hypothetical protein
MKKYTTSLERYICYQKINIFFDEELTKDIYIYNNKLKKSKIDECGICLEENTECIMLNCFTHYICIECYIKLYKNNLKNIIR